MQASDYDDVTTFLGEWGSFQKRIMLLLCISAIPNGLSLFSIVFLADTPAHHCAIPSNANISAEWINYSIPLEEDKGVMRYNKCTRYKLDVIQRLSDNRSVPGIDVNVTEIEQESCKDGWEYDKSIYVSTIVSEWDLVCSDAWKVPVITSTCFFGILAGSFISGQLSDRFGRKIVLFGTIGLHTLFTFILILSTSWFMFSALFFFVGMGGLNTFLIAFVLGAEILTPCLRTIYSTVGISIFFAIGYMLLPLAAFFIRDWRMLLIAINVPGVFYLPLWRLIPESPRWLLSQGRVEEAEAILRAAARKNRVTAPEVIFQPLQTENKTEKLSRHNVGDLVKSKNIRWITIMLSFVWIAVSIGYFALSLNSSNLHGNPFLNCFLSAAVEVPGIILSWPLLRSCSRRLCLFATLFLGGVLPLFTLLIPRDLKLVSIALEMMGKFGFSVAFTIVYPFTAELYPTVLRNTAVGTCSMAARLGSIAAPYFLYLGTYSKSLPYILMGGLCVLGGLLSLLLPETYGMPLPETLDHMQTIQRFKKTQNSNTLSGDTTAVENDSVF
ncbi:organic cation/carnitine transporter 2-like isoform X1 [Conger conger]|uniref:organic cation/carnitine transporter 2-like isoform X1 n=1 Tax=Conger conger TaxID=82655 RepID=UPI002A5B02B5|nr:organic cation/carnitine transporter 2-like isoform X1 [Conger conger]XP_061118887.1 organic cation/carnitine transporter 2-like isoform X1 [Conger conger]